jgi:hypothetical protein
LEGEEGSRMEEEELTVVQLQRQLSVHVQYGFDNLQLHLDQPLAIPQRSDILTIVLSTPPKQTTQTNRIPKCNDHKEDERP